MLRRHDYSVNIAGGFGASQLTSDYVVANGVRLPTRRRAYTRGPDRRPILEMLMVSIDISDHRIDREIFRLPASAWKKRLLHPEMWPMAYAMVRTVRPNGNDTPMATGAPDLVMAKWKALLEINAEVTGARPSAERLFCASSNVASYPLHAPPVGLAQPR